jgi:hypothetical protein
VFESLRPDLVGVTAGARGCPRHTWSGHSVTGWRRRLGAACALSCCRRASRERSLRASCPSLARRSLRSDILSPLAFYAGSRAQAAPSRLLAGHTNPGLPSGASIDNARKPIKAPDGSPGVRLRDCTNRSPRYRSMPDPRRLTTTRFAGLTHRPSPPANTRSVRPSIRHDSPTGCRIASNNASLDTPVTSARTISPGAMP